MKATHLSLVAAVARNGVIGGDNRLLWRIKADLRHFRDVTLGKPVIMGRKTFDSIGKPLPGRSNIVITRDKALRIEGATVVHDMPAALAAAMATGGDIMIAGGADIYAQTIGIADKLFMTEVALDPEGDALFPMIDKAAWREVSRVSHPKGPDDDAAYAFVDYVRR
jgi:dihydrofolate reductase